jgi:hypothetical protein
MIFFWVKPNILYVWRAQGQERGARAIKGLRQLRTSPPVGSAEAGAALQAAAARSADSASSSPSRRQRRQQQGARSGSLRSPHDSQASLQAPASEAAQQQQQPDGQARLLPPLFSSC